MRRWLTLDDAIVAKLRELARRRRIPFEDAVDSVLGAGWPARTTAPDRDKRFASTSFGAASDRASTR